MSGERGTRMSGENATELVQWSDRTTQRLAGDSMVTRLVARERIQTLFLMVSRRILEPTK